MFKPKTADVAIIDYHMGNLFSVQRACEHVGLTAHVTHSREEIISAKAVILPGVGAFGDAMMSLEELNLISTLREIALEGSKPFIAICLGMQLLMTESYEFGKHKGLDIISGDVVRFDLSRNKLAKQLKVPQVEWNHIYLPEGYGSGLWDNSLLKGLKDGVFMYFIHSFYIQPKGHRFILSYSYYGNIKFPSSIQYQNIFACQFHPERSGPEGLVVYKNLASLVKEKQHCEVKKDA